MNDFARRLEALETQQLRAAVIDDLAASTGLDPAELMAEAERISDMAESNGWAVAEATLADEAGITVEELRVAAELIG